ncbi:MAG: LCP family protein [Lachnospiraceae bacterium]|nr:LCP family protein [Lachnospiraceae bacterium]
MNRGRRNRRKWYLAVIAAGVLFLAVMVPLTTVLYRQKKETEARIAAREYIQSEKNGHSRSGVMEYQGKTYRRSSYVKAILCMGVDRQGPMTDSTTATQGGQADGVFVLAQDTTRNTLKILMIPRDTMTEITLTDLSGNVLGTDIQHLTLAYAYGDGREESCERMAEAVSRLLGGLEMDHYLAADTDVIAMLNDAVGGVTVTIPISGMEERDPAFVKGETVTLHGDQAEAFVRYRDISQSHSAITRMAQQQQYITQYFAALKKKSAKDSQIVVEIFDMIADHMVTDMGKEEYLKIAMDALNTGDLGADNFYTIPGETVTTEVYDEFYADTEALMPMILDLFYREVP